MRNPGLHASILAFALWVTLSGCEKEPPTSAPKPVSETEKPPDSSGEITIDYPPENEPDLNLAETADGKDAEKARLEAIANDLRRLDVPAATVENSPLLKAVREDENGFVPALNRKFYSGYINMFEPDAAENEIHIRDYIVDARTQLKRRGIDLIVVPVPNPLELLITLDSGTDGAVLTSRLKTTLHIRALLKEGVEVLDLREDFAQSIRKGRQLFHPFDHHWKTEGIETAAGKTASRILRYPWANSLASRHRSLFSEQWTWLREPVDRNILPHKMKPGSFPLRETFFNGAPLLRALSSPVLIVGDSMVLHMERERTGLSGGFPSRLAAALQFPVNYEASGAGARLALSQVARVLAREESPQIKVVVMVMASAYVPAIPWSKQDLETLITREKSPQIRIHTSGTVTKVSRIEDPATYPAYRFTIQTSDKQTIAVLSWAFQDHKSVDHCRVQVGDKLENIELISWNLATEISPALRTRMILDDLSPMAMSLYWWDGH